MRTPRRWNVCCRLHAQATWMKQLFNAWCSRILGRNGWFDANRWQCVLCHLSPSNGTVVQPLPIDIHTRSHQMSQNRNTTVSVIWQQRSRGLHIGSLWSLGHTHCPWMRRLWCSIFPSHSKSAIHRTHAPSTVQGDRKIWPQISALNLMCFSLLPLNAWGWLIRDGMNTPRGISKVICDSRIFYHQTSFHCHQIVLNKAVSVTPKHP